MYLKNKITSFSFTIFIAIILLSGCSKEMEKIPITTSSDEARELYLKGLSLTDRLRGQEAVAYFDDAIALDSNFAMAYIGLAFAQQNQTQLFSNLQKAFALKENISDGEKLWIEAIEFQINNQADDLRATLKKLINLYPNDERAHNFLATTYFGTQEYQKSIKHYLDALQINPNYSPVYNQLGYAYRFLSNYKEAEKMFQKYIELIPNDPNPYDSYGELLMKMGKFDESIRNYEKALSVNPYFTFSHLGIASNMNYKGEHVQARNRLQKFLTSAKNDIQKRIAYNGMITSYIDEGNLKAAVKTTNKMRQLAIEAGDTLQIVNEFIPLGILYLEMGELSEAETFFNNAMKYIVSSSFPDQIKTSSTKFIMVNLAMVDIKRSLFADAQQKADDFLKYAEEQNNPNLIRLGNQLLGMIALSKENYESAIIFLRKSNQNNPYNIYRIALAYESLGDNERAQSYFSKAANANLVSNRNYSFIRKKALAKIGK